MIETTPYGVDIKHADMCGYCHMTTGGEHEWGCPLHPQAVVWTPEGAMPI